MLLKNNKIAYLGILLALNQILVVLATIIDTNTMILFAGGALVLGVVIIELDIKNGIVFYVASCILGLILSVNKVKMISYIVFFGAYSIIKYLIEKKTAEKNKPIAIELILKFMFFNGVLLIGYYLANLFIKVEFYWWMIILAQGLFVLYDYAFSLFINYYIDKIKPRIG